MNKRKGVDRKENYQGVDGTHPGIDRERIRTNPIESIPGLGRSSGGLSSATEGCLYSVKDKLYPRSLGSDLVVFYRAPPFGLRFVCHQLKYFTTKIILNHLGLIFW